MPNQRNKRKTQKKVKGGWLWCETIPMKYISPCKAEELAAERIREAQQVEESARKKENDMRVKEAELQKKTMDAQMDAQITALKTAPTAPTKRWGIFGGRGKNKSQKRKRTKKSAKK